MRRIDKIILHCSASDHPHDIESVRRLHTSPETDRMYWGGKMVHCKGWDDVGYHWFITKSGLIQRGRSVEKPGAHVKGHNAHSIGICLEGDKQVGMKEQSRALRALLHNLRQKKIYAKATLHGHREFNRHKTCPNINYLELQRDWYENTLV